MGRKTMPIVKDNNPMERKRSFHWISINSRLVRAARETDHIQLLVIAVTWLEYCRYDVKLYSINKLLRQLF